jgi:hypothetical protein
MCVRSGMENLFFCQQKSPIPLHPSTLMSAEFVLPEDN